MVLKLIAVGVMMTIPALATAQAGPVQVKSDKQIVCELTGDCVDDTGDLATMAKPEGRGFKLFNEKAGAKAKVPPAPGYVAPKSRPVLAAGGARPGVTQSRTPVQPGRSTLSINFASGSSAIAASSRTQAQMLLSALKSPATAANRFIVAGHTDSVGGREYNLELSKRRAEALVEFLVSNGVDRSRLQPEGYGFDKPVPGLSAGAAANRRVEIVKID
ncbi:MAG: OmpA family protein [Novosphingobium sp.]|nr:OmpA family protein [Novosphingobium sp.]